jgi:hypothetical protein
MANCCAARAVFLWPAARNPYNTLMFLSVDNQNRFNLGENVYEVESHYSCRIDIVLPGGRG